MPRGTLLACSEDVQLGPVHPGTFNGSPMIDAELLAQELRSGRKIIVIDIRNKDEFIRGHIDDARSIPIHQLIARACEITTDRSRMIVIVSEWGTRAKIAAAALRLAGYPEVATLAGGMKRWLELALPVVTPSSRGLRSMKGTSFFSLLLCVPVAIGGCTSLFINSAPTEGELKSAAILKACPLGVPSTRVRMAETADGIDLYFSTSMSGVDELRARVRDQAKANGPERHAGAGHDGKHRGYHDHGLQLWSMGHVTTSIVDTPSGARLGIVPADPNRRDELRKSVIERVAHLESQGCHD